MTEVRIEGLVKTYGSAFALDNVSLTFPHGSFFGLLGPSGSGKTTLLRAIAGFVVPDQGRVFFDGEPVEALAVEDREIGMVFQNYALFPNMTVAQNVAFGLAVRKVSAADQKRRVAEVLDLVQLGDFGRRKPHELSGGQRQRVAMARAIVTRPRVLLLDEPLSALDRSLRVDMQIELKRIQREVGITTIFVTHDQEEALTLSDQIGILKAGKLIRHGAPLEVYENPRDAFTARFLGEANLFEVLSSSNGYHLADGTKIEALPSTHGDMLAIRPEHLVVSVTEPAQGPRLRATLIQRIFAGAIGSCVIDWQGHPLKATGRYQEFSTLPDQGPVWLSWSPDQARWVSQ
ncbi:MAG: ABC transporter ATP-binding protein [Candidatus Saccharibacteria bacterium]|nr:ABC transporter ATP-binding protein [Pseudorhodobacter sp.]